MSDRYATATVELGDRIANLTLKQGKELSDYLEEVHGLKPKSSTPSYVPPTPQLPEAPSQTEFDVYLEGFGEGKKVPVIKVVRVLTGLALVPAKELVEKAPVKVKEGVSKEEAEKIKKDLEEAGGTVSVR